MNVHVSPTALEAVPGEPVTLTVEVFNTGEVISAYSLRVFGLDPSWATVDEEQLSLFPETSGYFVVTVTVPPELPAGTRRLALEVTDHTSGDIRLHDVAVEVSPRRQAALSLEPTTVTGGRVADFGLVVTNEGNAGLPLSFAAQDEESKLSFEFTPEEVELAPGEKATVGIRARGKRPLIANPAARPFTVRARGTETPLEASAAFIQKPLVGRGLLGLVGLLIGVSVFAAVTTGGLSRVVEGGEDDKELLLEILEAKDRAAALDNPATVGGRVTLLTSGAPAGGVTVQLYDAAALNSPVKSTATSDDGAYRFSDVAPGAYKLRFQGAGFAEIWFPRSADAAEADEVEVDVGDVKSDANVQLGGVPGSIEGAVVGDDVADAVVTLSLPAAVAGTPEDAQVTSITVDDSGAFLLEDVASPSTYLLTVEKPGFATENRQLDLAAGEDKEGVEVTLRKGDGQITGSVSGPDGPIGGATITATDGITTLETVTLTRGAPGTFTLRNLATPGTYTIRVEKEGFASQTVSVSLAQAEQREGVVLVLGTSFGSVSGTLSIAGEGPAGGVKVTATSGELTVETVSLTAGSVGTYSLTGLPVPGTYTVTFSRVDLASQTRAVDLDPLGDFTVEGVNATLARSTATLFGTVRETGGGAAIGGATVTVTGGPVELTSLSAHQPPGAYEIRAVPPGTYTVTFTRAGSEPRSVLVTVVAGERKQVDARLDPPASISGTVRRSDTNALLPGAEVRLYRTSSFPSEVVAIEITNAAGAYRFDAVDAPEQYTITFSYPQGTPAQSSQNLTLLAGEQRTGVDALVSVSG